MSDNMAGFSDSTAKNISDALDINNTSRFSLQDVDFAFSYGGKLVRNEYKKKASGLVTDDNQAESMPVGMSGKQDISSLYSGLQANYGIWQGNFDLNYTAYRLSGYKPACDERVECFPQGAGNINRNEHGFNPSVMLSAQVTPWLQPFVSYSKSMRGPNIREVFFANSGGQSMNPFLKGEKAETAGRFQCQCPRSVVQAGQFPTESGLFRNQNQKLHIQPNLRCVKPPEVQPFAGDAGRVG